VIVEVHGLEARGRHGADEEERAEPQRFLFDVELEVAEPREDTLGATADYRVARDVTRRICERENYVLIETLAGAVADAIFAALPVERVRVQARKPGVTWAEWTAATAERP
jgi:7,8-dihydroneopterin aldolase/epimerase/oxygenase